MHLDGGQVIEDEDSRQLAPMMGVHCWLEVLRHRVLIALYRLVVGVDVRCRHHLQPSQTSSYLPVVTVMRKVIYVSTALLIGDRAVLAGMRRLLQMLNLFCCSSLEPARAALPLVETNAVSGHDMCIQKGHHAS